MLSFVRTLTVLLAVSSLPVTAQQLMPRIPPKPSYTIPWPAALSPVSFGRGISGDLTGDHLRDVVLLSNNRATMMFGVGVYGAFIEFPGRADDIDIVPRGGPQGLDALAIVRAEGLALGTFDPATQALAVNPLAGGDWILARAVRTADMDASGTADIVGISQDGLRVLTALQQSDHAWSAGPSTTAPHEVLQFIPMEWDGDPLPELAAMTSYGLEIFERNGTVRFSVPYPASSPASLVAVSVPGRTRQVLVWVYEFVHAPLDVHFMVLDMILPPADTDIGALDVAALAAADYDHDFDDDLFVSQRSSHDVIYVPNHFDASAPSAPMFLDTYVDVGIISVGPPFTPAPANNAMPVVCDLDNDGDADLLFPVQSSQHVFVQPGTLHRAEASSPWFKQPYCMSGHVNFKLKAPPLVPPSSTHVLIDVWRQPDISAEFDQQSIVHQERSLPASWLSNPATAPPLSIDFQLPETSDIFDRVYTIQVRFVAKNGSGAVVETFPSRSIGYATDPIAIQALIENAPYSLIEPVPGTSNDPTQAGAFVPRAYSGPFKANQVPKQAPPG